MKESIVCPICNKPGIPNFRKEVVVCPCCNSDLSIYRQIDELINLEEQDQHPQNNRKYLWWMGIICVLFICVGIYLLFSLYKERDTHTNQVISLNKEITILRDSLTTLQKETRLSSIGNKASDEPKDETLSYTIYIVRRGDSFCKISRILFGSEKRNKEISKLNNWPDGKSLQPGDSIKIPVK